MRLIRKLTPTLELIHAVIMIPRAMYTDPFRGAPHVICMCDNYGPKGDPVPSNYRYVAAKVFAEKPQEVPWFGIEQEYFLFKNGAPLGFPTSSPATAGEWAGPTATFGFPGPQGPYYCSAGADVAFGREIVEEHLLKCMIAGLQVSGTNAEVCPGQWEFQVGPCIGIAAGDQHLMARYLLDRVCEKYGVVVSYEPKPIQGDFNGSGCHTNFSTKNMREDKNGLDKYIIPCMDKLAKRHLQHIYNYGSGNEKRLTGHHETSSMHKFSYGVASRKSSVRIGNETAQKKKGYFEDRRPSANMNPYLVTAMIYDTCVLDAKFAKLFPSPDGGFKNGGKQLKAVGSVLSMSGSEAGSETGSEGSEGFGTGKRGKKKAAAGEKSGCAAIM